MSENYKKLGLSILDERGFSLIPSHTYLKVIEFDIGLYEGVDKVAFEWLSFNDSKLLLIFLLKHGANSSFEHHKSESIKFNMLEWLRVYNLILVERLNAPLGKDEEDLFKLFSARFDLLVSENPIDINIKKSFSAELKHKNKNWKLANNVAKAFAIFSILLIFINMFFNNHVITILTPILILLSGAILLFRDKYCNIVMPEYEISCAYSQMLIDHSY